MLERARGCIEHGGRRLLRLSSKAVRNRRLHSAFWSHGAGEIDLPSWWIAFLSQPPPEETSKTQSIAETARQCLTAGLSDGGFLDFLYPAKTLSLIHKLAVRDAVYVRNRALRQASVSGVRSYASATPEGCVAVDSDANYAEDLIHGMREPSDEPEVHQDEDNVILPGDYMPPVEIKMPSKHIDISQFTMEDRLEELYYMVRRYEGVRREYNKIMRAIEILDPDLDDQRSIQEALRAATPLYEAGVRLVNTTRSIVLRYLTQVKSLDDWKDHDWKVCLRILGSTKPLSKRFADYFRKSLERDKAPVAMPVIVGVLIEYYTLPKMQQAYGIYTRWRESTSSENQAQTRLFWEYIEDREDISIHKIHHVTSTLAVAETFRHVNSADVPMLQQNIIGLIRAVLNRKDFQQVEPAPAERFFKKMIAMLEAASPGYAVLNDFLDTVIWLDGNAYQRALAGRIAYHIFNMLPGGYKGESKRGPDLARKLFWRMCKYKMVDQALIVFDNMKLRQKVVPQDYSVLSFMLSRAGRAQAFDANQDDWEAVVSRFEGNPGNRPKLDIYHDRLEMYRRRNDLASVLDIFHEIQNDGEVQPDVRCYNTVISAHTRLHDLQGADAFFSKMVEVGVEPDLWSYVPFVKMHARRGDIDAVRALTQEIEQLGLPITDVIINAHIYALVQSGSLSDAEDLAIRAFTFKVDDRTYMWNLILLSWALRGDRRKVSLLMDQMRRNAIERNEFTYGALMQMWLKRKQPSKAWTVLLETMPKAGLRPLAFHYALVIKGYTDAAKPHLAVQTYRTMLGKDIAPDWSVKIALQRALTRSYSLTDQPGIEAATEYLKEQLSSADQADIAQAPALMGTGGQRLDEAYFAGYFDFMIDMTAKSNKVGQIEDLWNMYLDFVRRHTNVPADFTPPARLLAALMGAYQKHQAWAHVRECWNMIYRKITQADTLGGRRDLSFARRYALGPALQQYMLALDAQGLVDAELKTLIADVVQNGFELDNPCWNQYVRILLLNGPKQHTLAFETAELQIMAGWRGWPTLSRKLTDQTLRGVALRQKLLRYANENSKTRSGIRVFRSKSTIGVENGKVGFSASARNLDRDRRQVHEESEEEEVEYAISDEALGPETPNVDIGVPDVFSTSPSSSVANSDQDRTVIQNLNAEGSRIRRPEYSTLVYLAGAYVEMRNRLAFEDDARERMREIARNAPTVVKAILTMPRIDDELQMSVLGKR